ncbi:MAG: BON domain-containing protein [Sinobacterium sp.]|nr:BON domain-containing protein [Sinobacterium sp.]
MPVKTHLSLPYTFISKLQLSCFILLLCGALSSCSSFVAATASGPTEEDYGERTLGTIVEDNTIEAKAKNAIKSAHESIGDSNITVHSFNKVLLITGQVKSTNAKKIISQLTKNIRHVKRVHNELEILPPSSFSTRMGDNYLSSKVSSRLVFTDGIDSSRIDAIVENSTVYLMGLVTQEEASRSVAALQNVSGLEKIVRVFEYIDNQAQ